MSLLFSDTFDRANGAPGNGWTVTGGGFDILSNQLRAHVAAQSCSRPVPTGGENDVSLTFITGLNQVWLANSYVSVLLRATDALTTGYRFSVTAGGLGVASVSVTRVIAGAGTPIATVYGLALTSGTHSFTFRCIGSTIEALVDGGIVLSAVDSGLSSGVRVGLYAWDVDHWFIDNLTVNSPDLSTLYVYPASIPPAVRGVELQLSGVGTAWTPGVPGSPSFTVSAGVKQSQEVYSTDFASLTYDAPVTSQTVVIGDPGSGGTALLNVTGSAIPSTMFPPGLGALNGLLQWLNDRIVEALNTLAGVVVGEETPDTGETLLGWVRKLGLYDGDDTVALLLYRIISQLEDTNQSPATTRDLLISLLAEMYTTNGYPGRVTLPDLASAISAITPPDTSAIITAIGGVSDQVVDVATTLGAYVGTPATSAADLFTAIGGVDTDVNAVGATADSIEGKIDAMRGDPAVSLPGILAAVGASTGVEAALIVCMACLLVGEAGATVTETVDMVASVVGAGSDLAQIAATVFDFLTEHPASQLPTIFTDVSQIINDIAGVSSSLSGDVTTITDAISGAETDLASKVDALSDKVDEILAALGSPSPSGPYYPGADLVTQGTPVEVSSDTAITAPMAGCIIRIGTVPARRRYWNVGSLVNVERLGYLAFIADTGDADERQPLAWNGGIYLPIHLTAASGVVIHLSMEADLTVIPWSRV